MRQHLMFLVLCLLSASAGAEELLEKIQARLLDAPVIHGDFVQTRQLVGVGKTLKAEGSFVVDKVRGVVWKTTTPFPGSLRIGRGEIVQTDGTQILMRLSAEREPAVKTVGSVLFALFAGDMQTLSHYFQYRGEVNASGWKLHLTPRESGLGKLIDSLDIAGNTTVEDIVLTSASGDASHLVFQHVAGASALSASEAKDFE